MEYLKSIRKAKNISAKEGQQKGDFGLLHVG